MANASIYASFERMWQHVVAITGSKSNQVDLDAHVDNKSNPHGITAVQVGADPAGSASSALTEAKSYTDTKTSGLASTASVTSTVNTHNTSNSSHNDIRDELSELNTKVNNFLNVTDTTKDQLSEIIQLIEDNADDIESITSDKVNVDDIIDNLTTNVSNKPLSAAQGVVLNNSFDTLQNNFNTLNDKVENGDFNGEDGYTPIRGVDYWTEADKAEIKSYVDEAILGGAW